MESSVVERLGGLDVLVNNARIGAVGDVSQNTMRNGPAYLTSLRL
jgi:hypothetical protein